MVAELSRSKSPNEALNGKGKMFTIQEAETAIRQVRKIVEGSYVWWGFEEKPSPGIKMVKMEIWMKVSE